MVKEMHEKSITGVGRGPVSIKVFGVGGGGNNIVERLVQRELSGMVFLQADTDAQGLARSRCSNQIHLGINITHALGTGGDIQLGRAAARAELEAFKSICAHTDILFFVVGLGGGTGTGATPVLAQAAREAGALVLCIATLPFEFEGKSRARQADCGLHALKMASDGVICFPNQRSKMLIDQNLNALEAFNLLNDLIAENICAIWRMLNQPGLMNVNFSNLKNVLQGKHNENWFATVKVSGPDRGRRLLDSLLANPLLSDNTNLESSDAVLLSLTGGQNLTMGEVEELLKPFSQICSDAHILVGVNLDSGLDEEIELTLIASKSGDEMSGEIPSVILGENEHPEMEAQYLQGTGTRTSSSRFIAPPPEMSPEQKQELLSRQSGESLNFLHGPTRLHQTTLPLEIVSKGRFEKSQPTIHNGEDLDIPTYVRKGVVLN